MSASSGTIPPKLITYFVEQLSHGRSSAVACLALLLLLVAANASVSLMVPNVPIETY